MRVQPDEDGRPPFMDMASAGGEVEPRRREDEEVVVLEEDDDDEDDERKADSDVDSDVEPLALSRGVSSEEAGKVGATVLARGSLAQRLARFVTSEEYADVVFMVGEERERVPAHRALLAARSPVFAALLFSRFAEASPDAVVEVPDVTAEAFRIMLTCIYTDEAVGIRAENAWQVLLAAKKYQVEPLRVAVVRFMTQGIREETAAVLLNSMTNVDVDEERFALAFVDQYAPRVLRSDAFLQLKESSVIQVIRSQHLNCPEILVFAAVVEWAKFNYIREVSMSAADGAFGAAPTAADLRERLKNILPHVRFPLLPMDEMIANVGPSGLLSDEQLVELYMYIGMRDALSAGTSAWFCKNCTLCNEPNADKCAACGGTSKSYATEPWECKSCTLRNDAFAARCVACGGTERDRTKVSAEPSLMVFPTHAREPRVVRELLFDAHGKAEQVRLSAGRREAALTSTRHWCMVFGNQRYSGKASMGQFEVEIVHNDTTGAHDLCIGLSASRRRAELNTHRELGVDIRGWAYKPYSGQLIIKEGGDADPRVIPCRKAGVGDRVGVYVDTNRHLVAFYRNSVPLAPPVRLRGSGQALAIGMLGTQRVRVEQAPHLTMPPSPDDV